MPHQIIAPVIVLSINLPLAVWALLSRPRDPAYRAFGLLALALVVWNLGGAVGWYAGPDHNSQSGLALETWERLRAAWLRMSFVGVMLVAPNMVHLVLAARGRRRLADVRPGLWVALIYVPALILGATLDLGFVREGAVSNSWRSAFYDTTDRGALWVIGVVGVYMVAALWLCWPDARDEARREAASLFQIILAPWVTGVVAILVFGALRRERAPTAALWMMVMSQAAMFEAARLGMVELRVDRARWVQLSLITVLVGATVLLGSVAVAWLFAREVNAETALVMTIALVGACHVYAAVMPKLEALAKRVASQKGGKAD